MEHIPVVRFAKHARKLDVMRRTWIGKPQRQVGDRRDRGGAGVPVGPFVRHPIHEWTRKQATRAGIGFTELANGLATTDDPAWVAGDL